VPPLRLPLLLFLQSSLTTPGWFQYIPVTGLFAHDASSYDMLWHAMTQVAQGAMSLRDLFRSPKTALETCWNRILHQLEVITKEFLSELVPLKKSFVPSTKEMNVRLFTTVRLKIGMFQTCHAIVPLYPTVGSCILNLLETERICKNMQKSCFQLSHQTRCSCQRLSLSHSKARPTGTFFQSCSKSLGCRRG
jgi:hypothetical protein